MPELHKPADENEVAHILREAVGAGAPIEIAGAGTKRNIGRPIRTALTLSTQNMRGVTLYEPTELVISAMAGTPLSTVEAELAKHGQHLAFEPCDIGKVVDSDEEGATIGGVFATNTSGVRRVFAGAARDHLLGIRAVNGRGEIFKSGGRVMKNVTGYDLCKTMAGSWGTLSVLTEVTMKVLPQPEETATLIVCGLTDEMANEVMCAAMTTPYEVSGCVHLPAEVSRNLAHDKFGGADSSIANVLGGATTALRIENISSSVAYRIDKLKSRFGAYGELAVFNKSDSLTFWKKIQDLEFLRVSKNPVWRISTAPKSGHRVVRLISEFMPVTAAYDWSGGLVWLEVLEESADAGAAEVRRVVATVGGHATLIRAKPSVRGSIDVFQPLEKGVMQLSRGLKTSFDPVGILNPGRMYADV